MKSLEENKKADENSINKTEGVELIGDGGPPHAPYSA